MRSYRTFPPLPSGLRSDGKGGKVPIPAGSGRCGGLIQIVKRDPSSLFTQHPCAVPHRSICAVRERGPRPAARGIAFHCRLFPYRHSVTLPAVYLCCTFPEVAFGGRYPLSLPCGARTFLTAGLSASPRDCLFYSRSLLYKTRAGLSTAQHCHSQENGVYYLCMSPGQGKAGDEIRRSGRTV